jgi:hypothetical protein
MIILIQLILKIVNILLKVLIIEKKTNIMKIQKNWWGEKDKLTNIILKKVKLKKWYLL